MSRPFWILATILSVVVSTHHHLSIGQPIDDLPFRLMFTVPFTLLAALGIFKIIGIRP